MSKEANPDHPVHEILTQRWSPYGFDPDRSVAPEDLKALFEAARWAASSFNEQPWRYIAGTVDDPEQFQRVLACLAEKNQTWARNAPVLALGLFKRHLTHNDQPNRAAVHDLGAASASLTMEATARGLYVHQMIGIEPEKARETFAVPDEYEVRTALAIGYRASTDNLPDNLRERDRKPRSRLRLNELLFGGQFGEGWWSPG